MARKGSKAALPKSEADRVREVAEMRKRRAEFALVAESNEKWVWVNDPEAAFVAARITKEGAPDGSIEVEVGLNKEHRVVKKTEIGPFITRIEELRNHLAGACGVWGEVLLLCAPPTLARPPSPTPPSPQTWCAWGT